MKTKFTRLLIMLALLAGVRQLAAQGTAFTYQGRLIDGGIPATGIYDLQFKIFDATTAGNLVAGPFINPATSVSNGLFNVTLDFGANIFTGPDRWLEVGARTNGAVSFVTLNPREKILPQPYAIFAGAAATSANYSGPISLAQLPASVALLNGNQTFAGIVAFNNPSNSFAGNGTGLNGVPWSQLNGQGEIRPSDLNLTPAIPVGLTNSGIFPWVMTAADVNGDGEPDLIVANAFYDHTINVLTNTGAGSFGVSCTITQSSDVYQVVAADFNGDGKTDLAAATDSTLSVFTNDGTGNFTLSTSPAGSTLVAAADLNGDGKADLVTVNGSLTVLTNDGSGNFAPAGSVPGGTSSVAIADMNGDGKPDIIAVGGSNLTVSTNKGTGTFSLFSTVTVCAFPLQAQFVLAADVNGDGKTDAVVACQMSVYPPFGSMLAVLTNGGSGNLISSYSLTGELAFQYHATPLVAAADLDGDGRLDLVTANGYTNSLYVLRNTGGGNFEISDLLVIDDPTAWTGPPSVTIADINGDGRPDLVVADPSKNIVTILTNSSRILFQAPVRMAANLEVDGGTVMMNSSNQFGGTFSGDGSSLTGLNAVNITAGTLSDARLSTNVALRTGGNAFTGNQTIAGSVGIGINPLSTLDVSGTARIEGADNWDVNDSEGDFRVGNNVQRFKIGVATTGGGTGDVWMRAQGGTARVFIKTPGGTTFYSNEGQTAGVSLAANGTAWAVISDRNVKKDFAAVDRVAILEKLAAMPITQWHYKWETADVTPHIGPMAQDFKAAFYPGTDDKSITTQEADGVTFAAIQGLNQKLEETRAENTTLKHQNDLLTERLNELEAMVKQIAARK